MLAKELDLLRSRLVPMFGMRRHILGVAIFLGITTAAALSIGRPAEAPNEPEYISVKKSDWQELQDRLLELSTEVNRLRQENDALKRRGGG